MTLQENIKYVREKKIAGLLNEMVLHILSKTPEDPLNELIGFLEKRENKGGVAAPIVPQAPMAAAASAPAPRPMPALATADVARSEAEVLKTARETLGDKDYDNGAIDKTIADLLVNETLFNNKAREKSSEVPHAAKPVYSRLLLQSDNTTQLLDDLKKQQQLTLLHLEKRDTTITEVEDFICYKALSLIGGMIKNECKFYRTAHQQLDQVENADSKIVSFMRRALANTEDICHMLFQVEDTALKMERHFNGGMCGPGAVEHIHALGGTTYKFTKAAEAEAKHIFSHFAPGAANRRPQSPKMDWDDLFVNFISNEYVLKKELNYAKDFMQGNVAGMKTVQQAIRNSDKLVELARDVSLNHCYMHDGKAPKDHQALLASMQDVKEQIRQKHSMLTHHANSIATKMFTGEVNGCTKRMRWGELTGWAQLTAESAKVFAVADLEKAIENNNQILELLAKVEKSQGKISAAATSN